MTDIIYATTKPISQHAGDYDLVDTEDGRVIYIRVVSVDTPQDETDLPLPRKYETMLNWVDFSKIVD